MSVPRYAGLSTWDATPVESWKDTKSLTPETEIRKMQIKAKSTFVPYSRRYLLKAIPGPSKYDTNSSINI